MSGLTVSPTLQAVYAALVPFIAAVTGLTAGTNVVQGLPNRASMPLPGFISVQAVHRHRLRTNEHTTPEGSNPTDINIEEGVELRVQIDCYGPSSEDWATILSTTLRDEYGYDALAPSGVFPLHADDASMVPLVDGEEQYEERWMLEAFVQYDPVTTPPQQYANVVKVKLTNVQEAYPA